MYSIVFATFTCMSRFNDDCVLQYVYSDMTTIHLCFILKVTINVLHTFLVLHL